MESSPTRKPLTLVDASKKAIVRVSAVASAIQLLAVLGHHSPILTPVGWVGDAVQTFRDFFRPLWSPIAPIVQHTFAVQLTPTLRDALTLYYLVFAGVYLRGGYKFAPVLQWEEMSRFTAFSYSLNRLVFPALMFLMPLVVLVFFVTAHLGYSEWGVIGAIAFLLLHPLSDALFVPKWRPPAKKAFFSVVETILYAVGVVAISKIITN